MRRINLIFFVLILLAELSCEDALINNFPADVSFDVSYRMLEGKMIRCIEADQKGNVTIATEKKLYYLKEGDEKSYDFDVEVLDLAIAPDESLWIGTSGRGLGHLKGNTIKWYKLKMLDFRGIT